MVSVGCAAVWCRLFVQVYGVGCADIGCQLVVQLYGVDCADIGCQLIVQLYGVSCAAIWCQWLCSYMVSVGCAAIWCHNQLTYSLTVPMSIERTPAYGFWNIIDKQINKIKNETSAAALPRGRGMQIPPNNVK